MRRRQSFTRPAEKRHIVAATDRWRGADFTYFNAVATVEKTLLAKAKDEKAPPAWTNTSSLHVPSACDGTRLGSVRSTLIEGIDLRGPPHAHGAARVGPARRPVPTR